ncbi:MAG: SusC/RagA family TonB-linked outer membrane protein [Bacteroidetes bacterium]|nr:MAG: SusC/RagA family TonB-linked outer membrane protein [Bacteroidota bacterium]
MLSLFPEKALKMTIANFRLSLNYYHKQQSLNLIIAFTICLSTIFISKSLNGQSFVHGKISDQNGFPLSGATISVKGKNLFCFSDSTGSFRVEAQKGDQLVISFVGYKPNQVSVTDSSSIKINLQSSPEYLDQIIVTGYTSQKQKEIVGSVTSVAPNDLVAIPVGQIEQMLQGRVAGLTVITSGEPGANSIVRIHGIGNFGNVTPLYIIDGIQGDINSINAYDIESLQVLKDAAAYSIYGVRGANGAIVITTQKGKIGKTNLSYDGYFGFQQPLHKAWNLASPQEDADYKWLQFKNSGLSPNDPLYGSQSRPILPDYLFAGSHFGLFENDPLASPDLYNIKPSQGPIYQIVKYDAHGTDWYHEVFKPAFSQNHSIKISGGNEKNHYLLAFGYLDQQGTMINTYLKRFTTRVNTDFTMKNNVRVGENLQLSFTRNPRYTKYDFLIPDDIESVIITPSYRPVYDINGFWSASNGSGGFFPGDNPVAKMTLAKDDRNDNWQVFGNLYAEADFLKHFTIRTSFGGSMNYYYNYTYSFGSIDRTSPASLVENSGYLSSWTWTNTIKYAQTFQKRHTVGVIIGLEEINNYNRGEGGKRLGFYSDAPNYRFLTNGDPSTQTNYSAATASFLGSVFGQFSYGYLDKLFFTVTIRRDGSSVFGPENRFGWFPSIGAAWRMTEENFMKNQRWLTDLKLRASWGETGFNGNTNPLNQYTLYGGAPGDAFYDMMGSSNSTVAGLRMVQIGNPKTGWQKDLVTNIGFESNLFNGKIQLNADWYYKKSEGLLFQLSLPDILGVANRPNANIGSIENKGMDLFLGSKGNFTKNFGWEFAITLTTYHNRILKLNSIPYFDYNNNDVGANVRNEVGQSIGTFFGYRILGYFNSQTDVDHSVKQEAAAPGRFKYQNTNSDEIINDDDRTIIGNPNPDFTTGINFGLTYKNFDFTTFFYGSIGNDVYNGTKYATLSKISLTGSWTTDRHDAIAPIAEAAPLNFSNWNVTNSWPIEKGSYLRCKSLMLGYTFPGDMARKISLTHLRVYIQVLNAFTITKYSGIDPEIAGITQAWGIDHGTYPGNQFQFLFGINLNL